MILDKTRSRRGPSRWGLLLTLGLGAAVCVLLALLRPTTSPVSGAPAAASVGSERPLVTLPNGVTVRLAGVTETQSRAGWWAADGSQAAGLLPANTLIYPRLSSKSQGRAFAARLTYDLAAQPQNAWVSAPRFSEQYQQVRPGVYARLPDFTWQVVPDDHQQSLNRFQFEKPKGQARLTETTIFASAPDIQRHNCQVRYAVAAGSWTQSVNCPKKPGKTSLPAVFGPVIFTLITNPHHLPAAQAARGNAVFMVTDRLGSWTDVGGYERVVYALDSVGQIVSEIGGGEAISPDTDGHYKTERLDSIPNSLLRRVASFRLMARPYQWVEFNNVALQPAYSPQSAARGKTL